MNSGAEELLDNEWFVVRHSGETPEIALYSALHYLTEAEDGPRLSLTNEQCSLLKEAARERYQEIVLRDLQPENRDRSIYRGIKRSIINYQRFKCFCQRQELNEQDFHKQVAASLMLFLASESVGVAKGSRPSSINCSFRDLNSFARKVGLVQKQLPGYIRSICPE